MSAEHPHGTYERYKSKLKCRCQLCRDANTAWQKNYMRGSPEQRRKATDRLHVRKGRMVPASGPSGRLYWPGLYATVPRAFRRLVRQEIEQADRRARESDD